ncbi:MAG TPA: L,D-transpeptidase family protein [Gammaproteobacteria bacterium]|jgi:L,D-transpeptidase ErfK/SrfK|nr:L,D-transpeptidase family protein [Gammaproteobacteria bacterium]
MKFKIRHIVSASLLMLSTHAFATAYKLPGSDDSVIGTIQTGYVRSGDAAAEIAKAYDIGFNEIQNANPQIDMNHRFASGKEVIIPTQHLLPNAPRKGIVINLPEMRMYYYAGNEVLTYPIGIGKPGKTIPVASSKVIYKKTNPFWYPPQDIREFNLEQGVILPRVLPPGPDNPLGTYAIYMSIPTYLIHSTIFPESVGRRASFGCIRMYENDIESFFPTVNKGIPIEILNSPVKVGWHDKSLFMEAHEPLEEYKSDVNATLPGMVHQIVERTGKEPVLVDWQAVSFIAKARDGIPHKIGVPLKS